MLFSCHIKTLIKGYTAPVICGLVLCLPMQNSRAEDDILFLDSDVKPLINSAYAYAKNRDRRSLKAMRDKAVKPLKNIAKRSRENENYGQAIYIYKELYKLHSKIYGEYHRKSTRYLTSLLFVYQASERYPEKIKILKKLIKYYESQFGLRNIRTIRYMEDLAQSYQFLKAYGKADETYEKVIKVYNDMGWTKQRKYKTLLNRISDLYITQGDYRKAAPYFIESMAIKPGEKIKITMMNATKLYTYAHILQITGKYADAEDLYKQMLTQSKNPAYSMAMPTEHIYAHLGGLYHQIGAYDKALEYKQKAHEAFAAKFGKTNVMTAFMLSNLAETQLVLKQYNKALNSMKIVEIVLNNQFKEKNKLYIDKNFAMPTLALAYSKVGKYKKAETIFKTTLNELGKEYSPRHPLVTYANTNLVEVYYLQNRLDEADKVGLETLNTAMSNNSPLLLANIYFALAKIRYKQSLSAEAIFYAKQGINHLQNLRGGLINSEKSLQESFVDSQQENYEMLAGWLIDAGRLSEAEQVLAMLKEEEYFNFIRRNQTSTNPRATQAQLNSLETKQREILQKSSALLIKYSSKLRDLEIIDAKIRSKQDNRQIKKYKKLFNVAKNNFQQTMLEIKSSFNKGASQDPVLHLDNNEHKKLLLALGSDVALIHILPLEQDLRIILRTSTLNIAKKIAIERKKFNKAVNSYKQLVKRPDKPIAKLNKSSNQIYQWLIKPIEKELSQSNIKTIMFYKNGVLRYIPLATLYDGDQYLIEKYAISNYTAAAKQSFNGGIQKKWTIAGLGVSKQHGQFSPLRMVPFELDSIVKQAGNDPRGIFNGQVYVDEAFTAARFKISLEGKYNVNHIATHYKFMPGTESDSFLLMGDGSHLTLANLRASNYNFKSIDLLTLSACETAVSDTRSDGREVEGLATLVQRQGAKGVMATLWPVSDCSTGIFMQHFYQNRQKGLDKAAALRHSQIAFLSNQVPVLRIPANDPTKGCQPVSGKNKNVYRHPYFWAPFILMGNWK